MEIKGIDVSRWNGVIDWPTVANYGMGFAILRITEAGNVIDSYFEANYKGCTANSIPVGVYKYSYAVNVSEIQYEAKKVIEVLNGRKLDYPVFLDIEDKCQENLSKHLMMQMINAFREIIIKAGYQFGIYCGYSWYQYQLPEDAKKYDCWLAAYPSQDDGTMQIRLKPAAGIGWQYSSKAKIPGIAGTVDRNVFYKDYTAAVKNENKRIRKAKAEVVEKVHTDVTEELDVVTEEDLPQKKTDNIPEWPDGILDYLDETERNKVLEYASGIAEYVSVVRLLMMQGSITCKIAH